MLKDSYSYINTSIIKYVEGALIDIGNEDIPLKFCSMIDYVLSATLLKMTGCLEQKIDTIRWQLGTDNAKIRYDLLRESSPLSSKSEIIANSYNMLLLATRELSSKNMSFDSIVWNNKKHIYKSYLHIKSIFKDKIISELTGSYFKQFIDDIELSSLAAYYMAQQKLSDSVVCSNKKKNLGKILKSITIKLTLDTKKMQNMYENTVLFRHSIAHNKDSIHQDLPSINIINDNDFKYENYYYRYFILNYVDMVFIDLFNEYTKLKNKYML